MANKPKYTQIIDFIKSSIENGTLSTGSRLMTEKELSKMFHVSRQTANKALQLLSNEGVIERTPGRGSFVSQPHVHKNVRSHASFTDDMASHGIKASSVLIEYSLLEAASIPHIANALQLKPDDYVHYFVRLRKGDDMPIAISYSYIPYNVMPDFTPSVLDGSLSIYLKSIGVYHGHSECQMSAALPTPWQKRILQIQDNVALLCNHHITYDTNGHPYEYIHTYYIGNAFTYDFISISQKEDT